MKLIVSLDDKKLSRYLKKCPENCCFVCLGEKTAETRRWLNEHGCSEIKISDYDSSAREDFLCKSSASMG